MNVGSQHKMRVGRYNVVITVDSFSSSEGEAEPCLESMTSDEESKMGVRSAFSPAEADVVGAQSSLTPRLEEDKEDHKAISRCCNMS